jgi:hypothetical protein
MYEPLPPWWTDHESEAWAAAGFCLRADWAELDGGDPLLSVPALRLGYGAAVSAAYRAHAGFDADAEHGLRRDWRSIAPGRHWAAARDAVFFGWQRGRGTDSRTGPSRG